jgi:hypothetical protein
MDFTIPIDPVNYQKINASCQPYGSPMDFDEVAQDMQRYNRSSIGAIPQCRGDILPILPVNNGELQIPEYTIEGDKIKFNTRAFMPISAFKRTILSNREARVKTRQAAALKVQSRFRARQRAQADQKRKLLYAKKLADAEREIAEKKIREIEEAAAEKKVVASDEDVKRYRRLLEATASAPRDLERFFVDPPPPPPSQAVAPKPYVPLPPPVPLPPQAVAPNPHVPPPRWQWYLGGVMYNSGDKIKIGNITGQLTNVINVDGEIATVVVNVNGKLAMYKNVNVNELQKVGGTRRKFKTRKFKKRRSLKRHNR